MKKVETNNTTGTLLMILFTGIAVTVIVGLVVAYDRRQKLAESSGA